MRPFDPRKIDVVILCGGFGTRLQGVLHDRPKPMVEVNGRPFLDLLIDTVAHYHFTRFILCAGYKGDLIRSAYETRRGGLRFLISEEDRPLGTAGAIKNAEAWIESELFLVLNGDSFCNVNLEDFLAFHLRKQALLSMALTSMTRTSEYGVITLDEHHQVIRFAEKVPEDGTGLVNAGIYLFDRRLLDEIPTGVKQSLEVDLFPQRVGKGLYGYVTNSTLLDLGTPERLERARAYFKENNL